MARLLLLLPLALLIAAPQCREAPCADPLTAVQGLVDPQALAAVQAACPVCPVTAQARYATGSDYHGCVVEASASLDDDERLVINGRALLASRWIAQGEPAATLLPGPGENGHDPALASLAVDYDRQFFTFNAAPFGLSLDVHVDLADAASRDAITAFLRDPALMGVPGAFGDEAFREHSGSAALDVITRFGEYGDLGMFGGMPAAGEAFRYVALKRSCEGQGRGCDLLPDARARLAQVLEILHIAHAITGQKGLVVRGLRRKGVDPSGDPPIVPSDDGQGGPNPPCSEKPEDPSSASFSQNLRWREDQSGQYPDWIWMDNTSKDQATGWIYAMGAVYDVVHDDEAFDPALVQRLRDDAARMARTLMVPRGPNALDLTIPDGDGCVSTFHDMNPLEFEGLLTTTVTGLIASLAPPEVQPQILAYRNAFNALLGLAAMRTFCHVSGEADVCAFYYDDLVAARGWPALLTQLGVPFDALPGPVRGFLGSLGLPAHLPELPALGIDFDHETNYSNVNMAVMGFYGLLRYEPDPALRARYLTALEGSFWDTGLNPRQPRFQRQSFYDLIYAAFVPEGADPDVVTGAATTLNAFPRPPYWNDPVENCDATEIAGGVCTALDGSTITLAPVPGRNGALVADDVIPRAIRPPSNYDWRSNPYVPNGGGGDRLNPGGDFRGAYWLGRFLAREGPNLAPDTVGPGG